MLVSKKFLAAICFFPVENKARRKWATQPTQTRESTLASGIAAHLKFPRISNADFDLVTFF
jgi:hypothetical protein